MAETMRERMARAIAKRCGDEPDEIMQYPTEVRGQYERHPMWSEYLDFADDVLAAMREPTGDMALAGVYERRNGSKGAPTDMAAAIYTAMIDAARNETTEPHGDGSR